jgi:hypothetical protein
MRDPEDKTPVGSTEPSVAGARQTTGGAVEPSTGATSSPKTQSSEDKPFTQAERNAFDGLADKNILRPNPRHLKRLVNVYRLVRRLAVHKGEAMPFPYKTIRWLVMCAQWPYTTYEMLKKFDTLPVPRPETNNPLKYLFGELEKNADLSKQQDRLDDDISLLTDLIEFNGAEGWMTWDELELLQRYTINFNPAIEAVSEFEQKEQNSEA